MSSSDADRVLPPTSPFPSTTQSHASASLTDQHLVDALANSPDNGATLDFTHKNLTDVGEDGAERLATAARTDFPTDEILITRSALLLPPLRPLNHPLELHSATIVLQPFQPRSRSYRVYVI